MIIRMKFDFPKIRWTRTAEHALAGQVAKDTEKYVPMYTGSLTQRTRIDGDKIIYPGPYARFLYYGKVMVDPETGSTWARKGQRKVVTGRDLSFDRTRHSQATAHWFEVSKAQNLKAWLEDAKEIIKWAAKDNP